MKTYVLSDLYGCPEVLRRAVEIVDTSKNRLFILGNYVGKGGDIYECLQRLMCLHNTNIESPGVHALLGNSDWILALSIDDALNGSESAIELINHELRLDITPDNIDEYRTYLVRIYTFLTTLPVAVDIGDHILVHAALPNMDPNSLMNTTTYCNKSYTRLKDEDVQSMIWDREEFYSDTKRNPTGKTVVFGHTAINSEKNWESYGFKQLIPVEDESVKKGRELGIQDNKGIDKLFEDITTVDRLPRYNPESKMLAINTDGIKEYIYRTVPYRRKTNPDLGKNYYTLMDLTDLSYYLINTQGTWKIRTKLAV
jgi:hypothetical protein